MPKNNKNKDPYVGFVGLGEMGKGMAMNILKGGYPLMVFDIDKKAVSQRQTAGAQIARDISQIAKPCHTIILSLPSYSVVEEVVFGKNGLIQNLSLCQTVIDCGTTNPIATKDFHDRLAGNNITFIDAPVSGFPQRANDGTLTIMVGCENEKKFLEIKPLLDCMGETVVHLGGAGTGQIAKVINNVCYNIACATIAELLPLSMKMGLDPEKIIEIISTSTGQSAAIKYFGPMILKRNFKSGYAMSNAYKDMESIIDIMKTHKIPLPVTTAAVSTYQMALNQGSGNESKAAMLKVWEKVLGVTVKKKN